ncbi:hypothetical protein, partial [Nonomuraea cypriaca]|uniref:hypothetical protein n=1 Tax=Nonomuraea cypriaca TaxID=1187855 RepID=UPI001A9C4135
MSSPRLSPGKLRWTAIAAGAAVLATASTTAWVVMTDNDPTKRTTLTFAGTPPNTTPSTEP